MAELGEFEHGGYGDYGGVCFHGRPASGRRWDDRLAVSDRYIDPLFRAVMDRASRSTGGTAPKLVADWSLLLGWADAPGPVEITPSDARELLGALGKLTPADLQPYCPGTMLEACLRCAATIGRFIEARLAARVPLFIEDD